MTLQDIECFICVAETMSYTKASEILCISQPAVTKHIQLLENEFNVSFFDRGNKRSLKITEAGSIFFDALTKCRSLYNDAVYTLKSISENAPVIINLPKGIMIPYEYLKILNDFSISIAPKILQVNYIDSRMFADRLEKGELLICDREALPRNRKYSFKLITKNSVDHVIIVSKDHPRIKENKSPVPEDLAGCPVFLDKSMSQTAIDKYLNYLTGIYGHLPEDIVYTDSPDNVSVMLGANRGITLNTTWTVISSSIQMHTIKTGMTTDYYIVWNPDKAVNRNIIEALA